MTIETEYELHQTRVDTAPAPAVSVVIINKDERFLERTLEILRPQVESFPNGAEVVVIDASAGRLDDIRDAAPWVRWFGFSPPLGVKTSIPQQRNVGVARAAGGVIAFCDSGGEPGPGWLENLVNPILDGQRFACCGPVESMRSSVYRTANDIADGEVPSSPPTANMAFSRVAFDTVGGFDESFRYGSDVDFAWRLQDAGMAVRQVRSAVMRMDWGDAKRQTSRSRSYGAAQAQLWLKHHRRWRALPRTSPALIVYPLWLAALVPAVFRAARRRPRALIAWCAVPIALVAKNSRSPQPAEVVRQNAMFGVGALTHLSRRVMPRRPVVLFMPSEDGAYQGSLRREIDASGLAVGYFPEPTRSETANLLLLMGTTLWARATGTRIVHVHWTYKFRPSWAHRSQFLRRCWRLWFDAWLRLCHAVGIKVVWTAHNILPHNRVFDDDALARQSLINSSAAVIALNDHGSAELMKRWEAPARLIAPAVDALPRCERADARDRLSVDQNAPCAAWFGLVERYKGVDRLVDAAHHMPWIRVLVAGACRDPELAGELHGAIDNGSNHVTWQDRRLSDVELAQVCAAADLLVFPFREVAHSASVHTALAAGRPVAIPDLPGLSGIPDNACIRFPIDASPSVIATTVEEFFGLSDQEQRAMGRAAEAFSRTTSWEAVAAAHIAVYREVLS